MLVTFKCFNERKNLLLVFFVKRAEQSAVSGGGSSLWRWALVRLVLSFPKPDAPSNNFPMEEFWGSPPQSSCPAVQRHCLEAEETYRSLSTLAGGITQGVQLRAVLLGPGVFPPCLE